MSAPTSRPRTQTPRLARSTCDSLAPIGEYSSDKSHSQVTARYGVDPYSGRLSANRLTRRPSAAYSSTADVRRYVSRSVWDQTTKPRLAVSASEGAVTSWGIAD